MLKMNPKAVEEAEFLVLVVQGGIGRNIMATAVVRELKREYPDKKIVVMCGCPEIFLKNPHIYRVYALANPVYFYEDFVQHRKSVILDVEPYRHFDYIYKRKHFVQCWCEMLGIECKSVYPELFLTDMEQKMAVAYLKGFDRQMVLCQFEGGKIPEGKDEKSRIIARSAMYRRSIPEAIQTEIVDALNLMNFKVGVVAHENTFVTGACERIFFPIRAILALIPHVVGIITIDSFLMHGASIFNKKSLVLWSGTNPDVLGYDCHVNVRRKVCDTPECHRPNSYAYDIEPNGFQWECQWNNKCCDYTGKEIIEEFDKMTGSLRGEIIKQIPEPPKLPSGVNPYEKCPCDSTVKK